MTQPILIAQVQTPVQPKSRLAKNWKLLAGLLAAIFVLGIIAVLGIFSLVMSSMKGSDPAKQALARARSNPAVVQQLGTPIEEGWFVSGAINVSSDSGDADLALPISGPMGKAVLHVTASKSAGTWTYSLMQASMQGSGEKIDLLEPSSNPAQTESQVSPSAAAAAPPPASSEPGGSGTSSTAPPPGSMADGIGSADGEQAGTRVVVTELKRSGDTVTLKFTIYNDSNAELDTGSRFNDSKNYKGFRNFSLVHLIDAASKKKYFVAADSDGNCVCSEGVDDIKPKTQVNLWAKFPAPPDSVQKITVEIPHFNPIDDVPIK